jgi:hypothetical protein
MGHRPRLLASLAATSRSAGAREQTALLGAPAVA